ncbi:MAG: hypothetical protein BECKG1743D_GA0114223_108312 [Candidatus Kentron sp. G]|nr:MAG: hypothetical protein BECKG1743F_GA0114225_108562 [Candidatus Kentron sp. G]VFN05876.1 MAG: hypothetical protein BECKG1743E_GA0114224_109321 [Candidatus Kentron sp. G]VFN06231.1 MAG: hypothetical protein BECKG1743D_GA0114223_108312 [Candidatus Kentron sp. G]
MGTFDVTSLLVWLLFTLGALLFFAAGYLLARAQSVSLRLEVAKYRERLGEAEKRISQMEWLEDERHAYPHEKEPSDKTAVQEDYPSGSIQKASVLELLDVPVGGLGDSLETFLRALSEKADGCQAAVLADEQGFLVAGVGQYEENLAAIAAVCSEVGDRVIDILPFGKLQEIRMIDENGLTAMVYSIPAGVQWLTLVVLSAGDNLEREVVKQFIKTILSTAKF